MSEEIENEPMVEEVQEEPQYRVPEPVISYDSEWVRFLNQLSSDESLKPLSEYIDSVELTDRAKKKLKVYISTLLDKEFAVSRIENREDFLRLMDKKQILDADLPLGLVRFDITPEFQHILDLIAIKFDIKIRRSMVGFERKIIATQRSENISEERVRNTSKPKKTTTEKVRGLFE